MPKNNKELVLVKCPGRCGQMIRADLGHACKAEEEKMPVGFNQEFTTQKEARASRCRQLIWVLEGLLKFVEVFANSECKTVGNMNPEGLHCFSCTFNDISRRIKRAIDFWQKDDMYKETLS